MNVSSSHPTVQLAGYVADDSIDFDARYGRALHARAAGEGFALVWAALKRLAASDRSAAGAVWPSGQRPAACGQG